MGTTQYESSGWAETDLQKAIRDIQEIKSYCPESLEVGKSNDDNANEEKEKEKEFLNSS